MEEEGEDAQEDQDVRSITYHWCWLTCAYKISQKVKAVLNECCKSLEGETLSFCSRFVVLPNVIISVLWMHILI